MNEMNERQIGWRIKTWDRSLGRGEVTSLAGDLPFDGSAALVSDFVIGEPVEIELRREGEAYRVARLWPDDPRFRPPSPPPAHAPALDAEIAKAASAVLAQAPGCLDYRVASAGSDLIIEGDDDGFAYGRQVELTFSAVGYLELPAAWDGKSLRLADSAERDYLAGRHELTARTIAVRIVDSARRIYFVTCEQLACSP